jgi:hypothetical protein
MQAVTGLTILRSGLCLVAGYDKAYGQCEDYYLCRHVQVTPTFIQVI